MRTINKYFLLLAATLVGFASCQPDESFKPGAPEEENCEGVYFPKQKKIEEVQIFDPTQAKLDTILVSRVGEDSALVFSPVVTLSYLDAKGNPVPADSATLAKFKVADIAFDAGQTESKIALDFNGIEEGVQYNLHIAIVGDQYASKYSSALKACDYKVMCVKYVDFVSPADSTKPARVTFSSAKINGVFKKKIERVVSIKYYEVAGIRHCITFDEAPAEAPADPAEELGGLWGQDPDVHLQFDWYVEDQPHECAYAEADGTHHVTIPAGINGVPEGANILHIDNTSGQFYDPDDGLACYPFDYYGYYKIAKGYGNTFLHFFWANNFLDMIPYYDNNGGFYFWILGWAEETCNMGYWPQDYDLIGIADGFIRNDFKVELTAGMTQPDSEGNNVVPVEFKLGADVAKVGYTILKGAAAGAVVNSEAAEIAKDTTSYNREGVTYKDVAGVSFSDSLSAPKTGVYTLVVVGFDAKKKAQTVASVSFEYLATGEANPVVLSVGAANSDNYVSRGYDTDTSFEFSISGSGITGAIPMFYVQSQVNKLGGIDHLVDSLMAMPNKFYSLLSLEEDNPGLTAKQLAAVNDKGYVDIYANDVEPGLTYYVVVWATNGYAYTVKYASVKTTGIPLLPIYKTFTYNNYDESYELKDASEWIGTWNLYGKDAGNGDELRTYLGKAVISESATPTDGPDEEGFYDEYVYVKGLFGDTEWIKEYVPAWDDTYEMDVYAGCMYAFQTGLVNDAVGDCEVMFYSKGQGNWGWPYVQQHWACFIPVMEGYYALVDNTYGDSYNFCGLGIASESLQSWLARVSELLLVDPSKDDNGIAPVVIKKAVRAAKDNFKKCVLNASLSGLNGKQAARAAIEQYMKGEGIKGLTVSNEVVKCGHKISDANPSKGRIAKTKFSSR